MGGKRVRSAVSEVLPVCMLVDQPGPKLGVWGSSPAQDKAAKLAPLQLYLVAVRPRVSPQHSCPQGSPLKGLGAVGS